MRIHDIIDYSVWAPLLINHLYIIVMRSDIITLASTNGYAETGDKSLCLQILQAAM